jgi:hypothetical protein
MQWHLRGSGTAATMPQDGKSCRPALRYCESPRRIRIRRFQRRPVRPSVSHHVHPTSILIPLHPSIQGPVPLIPLSIIRTVPSASFFFTSIRAVIGILFSYLHPRRSSASPHPCIAHDTNSRTSTPLKISLSSTGTQAVKAPDLSAVFKIPPRGPQDSTPAVVQDPPQREPTSPRSNWRLIRHDRLTQPATNAPGD